MYFYFKEENFPQSQSLGIRLGKRESWELDRRTRSGDI